MKTFFDILIDATSNGFDVKFTSPLESIPNSCFSMTLTKKDHNGNILEHIWSDDKQVLDHSVINLFAENMYKRHLQQGMMNIEMEISNRKQFVVVQGE